MLHSLFIFIFQIVLEGVRGVSYRGDIAIDDTNVIAGTCHGMFLIP